MSKIGKNPIIIPSGVEISFADKVNSYGGKTVNVKGPNGTLSVELRKGVELSVENGVATMTISTNSKPMRAYWGLYRSLVNNAVEGVSKGYKKQLEIQGIGYKAELQNGVLSMKLGYTHPIVITPTQGVSIEVKDGLLITVSGSDKQAVGHDAQRIHDARKPEPYKGKGVRYVGENVRRKSGKTAASK